MDKCRHVFRLRLAQDHSIMNPQKWLCAECGTTESVWACLGCSHVACGRYISEHALLHFQNTGHPLALEVNELHVYCYACDDYVLNDNATGDLRLLRSTLSAITSQRYQLTTRSGRTLRSGAGDDTRPSERRVEAQLRAEDRMFTALWHRRLALARKVFTAWAGLTESGRRRMQCEIDTAQEQRHQEEARRKRQERRRRHQEELSSRPLRKSPRLSTSVAQQLNRRAPAPTPSAMPSPAREPVTMAVPLAPLPPSPASALPQDASSPPLKRKPTVTPGVTGLRNLGNTCYMNSILQVLSHLQAFRQCFLLLDLSGAGSDPCATSWPLEGDDPTGPRRQPRHAGLARQLSEQCYRDATGLGQAAAIITVGARRERRRAGLSGGGAERVTYGQQRRQLHGQQQQQQREEEEQEERVSLCHELHTLFRVMWSGKWALVSPYAMLHSVWRLVPSFKGYAQQDAQEFLCELLDKVLQELEAAAAAATSSSAPSGSPVSPVSPRLPGPSHANVAPVSPFPCLSPGRLPPSPLSQRKLVRQALRVVASIFQGELLSQVTCLSCAHTSRRNEPFWDLSLDFPERYHGLGKAAEKEGCGGGGAGGSTNGICTLTEMLAKFTETEALDGGKVYSCDTCNGRRRRSCSKQPICTEAQKQLLVHRLPRVLRLHLKRFRWSGRNHREKIGVHVAFEQRLCMAPYCSRDDTGGGSSTDPCTYDLSAVVMHHGRGFDSGHYTAYCYNAEGGFWVHCNDSRLDVVSVAEVCHAQAYILFYTRRRAGGPQTPACPASTPAVSSHAPLNHAASTTGRRRRRRLDLS